MLFAPNVTEPDDRPLEDLLAAHADALRTGSLLDPLMNQLKALPTDESAQARELLLLAQRLHETLVPVAPSNEFLARLKQELLGAPILHQPGLMINLNGLLGRWQRLPPGYRVITGLGGLTLTAGLTLLAGRGVLGIFNRSRHAKADTGLSVSTVS